MRTRWIVAGWIVGMATLGGAGLARAEEPADPKLEELKKQVQKVLDLMARNEKALLAASTGQPADPTKPDVPVPPVPPSSAERRATSSSIPREIEELIRMWPT